MSHKKKATKLTAVLMVNNLLKNRVDSSFHLSSKSALKKIQTKKYSIKILKKHYKNINKNKISKQKNKIKKLNRNKKKNNRKIKKKMKEKKTSKENIDQMFIKATYIFHYRHKKVSEI